MKNDGRKKSAAAEFHVHAIHRYNNIGRYDITVGTISYNQTRCSYYTTRL